MRYFPIDLVMGNAAAAREEAFDDCLSSVWRIDLEALLEREFSLRLATLV